MKLLTIQELAKLLNAKVTTIYSWINRDSVPYLKFNGLVRFDVAEIEAWIEESRRPHNVTKKQTVDKVPSWRLLMGLYRRGQTWWMKFTVNGTTIRRSTETKEKRLAEKIYCKVITQVTEGKWFDLPFGSDKTLSELLEKYLREHSERNKALSSFTRDKLLSAHLLRSLGNPYVTDLRTRSLYEYKVRRRDEGASPKTVNEELQLLHHAYNPAIREWEWLEVNPVSKVSREQVHNERERWLSYDEEERLLRERPSWLREVVLFAINTSLRRGEILNLRWDRVDLFRRIILIFEQQNRGKDTLPLNSTALDVLTERYKVKSKKTSYVFFSLDETELDGSNVRRAFLQAMKRAQVVDFRFHDLRHTFATRLVQAGVDLYKVQRLMRHKSPQMTQRYAHHYPESLRDGVEVLDLLNQKRAQFRHSQADKKKYRPRHWTVSA